MNKKYQVIYCDPPWRYGVDGQYVEPSRKIERHYPTMSLDEIKALKVPAENNSVLFLWTTTAKLSESLEVMKEWGFFYKSSLIWDKVTMGMGFWFRGQHEILLVGVKGSFSPPPTDFKDTFNLYGKKNCPQQKTRQDKRFNSFLVSDLFQVGDVRSPHRQGFMESCFYGRMDFVGQRSRL